MAERPEFSVIIPIYKVEAYLRTAIESVLSQRGGIPFELILVDDGSPDGCPSICDAYAAQDERVRVIHKENGGVISARKAGALIAEGEYSVCLDGDDWLHPALLETLHRTISGDHGKPDIICFEMVLTDGSRETRKTGISRPGYFDRTDIERDIFPILIQKEDASYFAPGLCGKAIRTELYREIQNYQKGLTGFSVTGEDRACTIACICRAESVCVLGDYLYYYRYNRESATKSGRVLSWESPVLINDMIREQTAQTAYDFSDQLNRKIVHDIFHVVLSRFNGKEPYRVIRRDILIHLKEPYYAEAIHKAKFRHSWKAAAMMLALRLRLMGVLKLYSAWSKR